MHVNRAAIECAALVAPQAKAFEQDLWQVEFAIIIRKHMRAAITEAPAVSPESNTGQNVADETRGGHETN